MNQEHGSQDIAVYGGYIENERELLECASGGIATAISREMIAQGGYVAGVCYSDDFRRVEYRIAHTQEELDQFKGSKYVEVERGTVFSDVKRLLEQGEQVLFFGLPCVVASLRAALGQDYERLLTCELVCYGATYARIHSDYLAYLEKKFRSSVVDFSVRKKKRRYQPVFLYARFSNGCVFQRELYSTDYGFAFSVLGRPGCYACKLKGERRTGDIMLGDFFGVPKDAPYWNEKGVSVVFAHTQKGEQFLSRTHGIRLFPTDEQSTARWYATLNRPRRVRPERAMLEKLYPEKSLRVACRRSKRLVVRYIPSALKSYLKELSCLLRR